MTIYSVGSKEDRATAFYLLLELLEGQIDLFLTSNGEVVHVWMHSAGEYFGQHGLLSADGLRLTGARTTRSAQTLRQMVWPFRSWAPCSTDSEKKLSRVMGPAIDLKRDVV